MEDMSEGVWFEPVWSLFPDGRAKTSGRRGMQPLPGLGPKHGAITQEELSRVRMVRAKRM